MLRITLRDPDQRWDRRTWDTTATTITGDDVTLVAAYADRKTIDLYVDVRPDCSNDDIARRAALVLGLDEYEHTEVESLPTRPRATDPPLCDARHAPIVRVWADPGGRTLRVETSHRVDEAVHSIEVEETAERVRLRALVAPSLGTRSGVVSRRIVTTVVAVPLEAPLGERRIAIRPPS